LAPIDRTPAHGPRFLWSWLGLVLLALGAGLLLFPHMPAYDDAGVALRARLFWPWPVACLAAGV